MYVCGLHPEKLGDSERKQEVQGGRAVTPHDKIYGLI